LGSGLQSNGLWPKKHWSFVEKAMAFRRKACGIWRKIRKTFGKATKNAYFCSVKSLQTDFSG